VCLFLLVSIKVMHLFVLVHTDLWGLSRVVSLFGYRWFVSFIDDFFRTTWIYLLKDKSDVFSMFHMFYKMVQTQFNATIKIVRSDNEGECLIISRPIFTNTTLSTKPRVLIHHSKMVWLKGKISTC
jgi:hypothetical protein